MTIKQHLKKYSIVAGIITLVIAVVVFFLLNQLSGVTYIVPMFYASIGLCSIWFLIKYKSKALLKFNSVFMLVSAAKLLLYLIFFLISYSLTEKDSRTIYAILYMILYLVFTVYDTTTILKIFKDNDIT